MLSNGLTGAILRRGQPRVRLDELSALFVRFLLLDRELSPRFRAWLAAQTFEPRSPESLPAALAIGWPSLERRFASWVAGP